MADDPAAHLVAAYGQRAVDALVGVLEVCHTLAEFTSIGREEFLVDTRSQWAAEMGLIRIGEGINRVPADFLEAYPDQPWRLIVDMRNFAAHQYNDLDASRVWRTLTIDVPALLNYLETVVLKRPR